MRLGYSVLLIAYVALGLSVLKQVEAEDHVADLNVSLQRLPICVRLVEFSICSMMRRTRLLQMHQKKR